MVKSWRFRKLLKIVSANNKIVMLCATTENKIVSVWNIDTEHIPMPGYYKYKVLENRPAVF